MLQIRGRHTVPLVIAGLFLLQSSLPVSSSVTCAVRKHGKYVCTFFCQNGFICDNANLRCLPGPGVKQKLSELKEKARLATLENNRVQAKAARQANSQSLGYDLGSTYYIWNGDPREIPTPRYRQGGNFISGSAGHPGTTLRQPTVRQSLHSRSVAMRGGSTVSLPSIMPGGSTVASSSMSSNSSSSSNKWNGLPKYWEGTDYTDYCAKANSVDRGSALYGYLCTPAQPSSASQDQDNYRPFPDPKDLDRKVSQICGPYSRDTRQCFFENKLRIILDNNPDIREACASKLGANSVRDQLRRKLGGDADQSDPNDNAYNRCVDDAYLHGLHPKSTEDLRETLRQRLRERSDSPNKTAVTETEEPVQPPQDKLPNDGCPPGSGLKPDRTAFGAWTCQPLGGGFSGPDGKVASAQGAGANTPQDQGDAADPTPEELKDYLNMLNTSSGGTLGGDLGYRNFPWGTDDYQAIERLQQP
jgi:hypothetical protein